MGYGLPPEPHMLPILLSLLWPALAQDTALVGAVAHPVSGPPIDDAVVLLRDGVLTAVGPRDATPVPPDAQVVELPAGAHIIPGLIDLHSHIGGGRLHEGLGSVQGGISAIDAIDPTHPSIQRAQAGGITTANVMPGSGKLLGGQTALLSLRDAAVMEDLLICRPRAVPVKGVRKDAPQRRREICGGVKMANGTNPQGQGKDPRSRMGAAYLQRKALTAAAERMRKQDAAWAARDGSGRRRGKAPKMPDPDLAQDGLVEVLRGERTVHFHSHRADDIVTAVRLKQEFGFDLIVHHGSEGFKVAPLLAEAGVPVAINVLDTPGARRRPWSAAWTTPPRSTPRASPSPSAPMTPFRTPGWSCAPAPSRFAAGSPRRSPCRRSPRPRPSSSDWAPARAPSTLERTRTWSS